FERREGAGAEGADARLAGRLGLLERDKLRARADEAVTPEPSALDRLEQERAGRVLAQAEVGADRREEVGWELGSGQRKRVLARPPRASSREHVAGFLED